MKELSIHSPSGQFSLVNGLIYFKSRIWVGDNISIQQHILEALHSSLVGGHSGVEATYHRVTKLFAWPHLKQIVQQFVSQCSTCQQTKTEKVEYPGLLALCLFLLESGKQYLWILLKDYLSLTDITVSW